MTLPHLGSAPARSAAAATALLVGAALVLVLSSKSQPGLAAANNDSRPDIDRDGLTDAQELVLGTLPDDPDTDEDGYSDLEEKARCSDPLDAASLPEATPLTVGTCASCEEGIVSLASAVYVQGGDVADVDFRIGVVIRGKPISVLPSSRFLTRVFIYPGRSITDRIGLVEIAIPENLVQRLGQLNLFSIVRGVGPNDSPPAVSVFSLASMGGVTVSIEPRNQSFTSGGSNSPHGVIYRPLAGDDQIPATFSGGEVCWQKTTPVGMNGVSIVHEVESADCQPMDTYCSGSDCAASVGKPLELPDPGALIGG